MADRGTRTPRIAPAREKCRAVNAARTASEKQLTLEVREHTPTSSTRTTEGGKRPPFVRCQCGRLHRSWNPRKVCGACVRESRSSKQAELTAMVLEQERRRLRPSPGELAIDNAARAAIHARWLSRQSLDHPWRVATGGGEA